MKVLTLKFFPIKEALPAYGEPVIIQGNGVIQHVTYTRATTDGAGDWFEPYHFNDDDNHDIELSKVQYWAYIPKSVNQ